MGRFGFVFLASLILPLAAACGEAASQKADENDDALEGRQRVETPAGPSFEERQKASDEALTALLDATQPVTIETADAIIKAVITPAPTTARMKLANAFAIAAYESADETDPYDRITSAMHGYYMIGLHDLAYEASGQTFEVSGVMEEDNPPQGFPNPAVVTVKGTATKTYKLQFRVGAKSLSVTIAAGATAKATAKSIAAAIQRSKSAIEGTWDDLEPIGGGDSYGFDDWDVEAKGESVEISISLNS